MDALALGQEVVEQLGDVARLLVRSKLRHHVPPQVALASLQPDRCALGQPVPLHEAMYLYLVTVVVARIAMPCHLVTRIALNGTL